MKGIIVKNRYYSDSGQRYVTDRLKEELKKLSVDVTDYEGILSYGEHGNYQLPDVDADFVIFFDKDAALSRALEKKYRVFNRTFTLIACDDKEKTYAEIEGMGIRIPPTVIAPLMFETSDANDVEFQKSVIQRLGFPMIVKENVGSLGMQVHLASNEAELTEIRTRFKHTPHMYQRYEGKFGSDIRTYVVGGKVVAACKRQNTASFKSNISMGGDMELISPDERFINAAERIATRLKMDYGSVDFADASEPIFLEANSNAYFRAIEKLGVNIAAHFAAHIVKSC